MGTWRYTCTGGQGHSWPLSKVTHISLILDSCCPEAIEQTEDKLQMDLEPSWEKGTQTYGNNWGHMTKMSAMPIYGKNLYKSSSSDLNGQYHWNFVYSIGHSSTTKFVQMMTQGWPLTYLYKGQLWFVLLLYVKMLKWWITLNLLKSIYKVSMNNEYMKIHLSQGWKSFFEHYPIHPSSFNSFKPLKFSSETTGPMKIKFYVDPPWYEGTKVYSNGPDPLTKIASIMYYGENL